MDVVQIIKWYFVISSVLLGVYEGLIYFRKDEVVFKLIGRILTGGGIVIMFIAIWPFVSIRRYRVLKKVNDDMTVNIRRSGILQGPVLQTPLFKGDRRNYCINKWQYVLFGKIKKESNKINS